MIGNSWATIAFIGLILCVATTICSIPIPDSPRLLLAQGKEIEFKKAIDRLASWNKTKVDWSQIALEERINRAKMEQ